MRQEAWGALDLAGRLLKWVETQIETAEKSNKDTKLGT